MTDRAMAELREHEAREEQLDMEYAGRIEKAKGYVNLGDFDITAAVEMLVIDSDRFEQAIANEDLCEAGRLLREAVIEQVARELGDD